MATPRQRSSAPTRTAAAGEVPIDAPKGLGTRDRLLAVGLEMARQKGLKALSVRAVAAEAGVNLGSFVYHFGTRDAFIYELVEGWYAPLLASLQLSTTGPDALRDVLRQLAQWVATHGHFLTLLLRDAASGEAGVRQFLATMDQRHIALLLDLIAKAQQTGQLRRADPTLQLMFVMGSVVLPILMVQGLNDLGPDAFVKRLRVLAADAAAIDTRIDWALSGLATSR